MAGSVYTFLSRGSSSGNDGAITTSQGSVVLGQSGLFLPSEYQAVVGSGLQLVAGPAQSPASLLTAPTLAAGASGLPNGAYRGAVTFVTAAGETKIGPEVLITVVNDQISWTNIPTAPAASGVTARKLYRTVAGGSAGTEKLVTTLSDDSTTTYTDNVADGSLGATCPASDTSAVVGATSNINPQPDFALLTGSPADDQYAIGAGTGAKVGTAGGILAYQTGTAYTSGTQVIHSGQISYAQTNFTSGASFSADGANWGQSPPLVVSVASNPTGAGLIPVSTGTTGQVGSWLGTTTLAANATTGFMGVPTVTGTPSGTPTTVAAETRIAYDATSHQVWAYDGTAWSGIGSSYSVLAPKPTGVAATDTTNLQAAISATPAGGTLQLHLGVYVVNAALPITQNITIRGKGIAEVWGNVTQSGGTQWPGVAPWINGTVIQQNTASTNTLSCTATGIKLDLYDVGFSYGASIAFTSSAAPAIYGVPPVSGTGLDNGFTSCRWENIVIFGNGSEGFHTVNNNYGLFKNLRTYGGGGWYQETNSQTSAFGNGTVEGTYFAVICASGNGFTIKSGASSFPGVLGLMTYIRPQANMLPQCATSGTPLPTAFPAIVANPCTNAQQPWEDIGQPNTAVLINCDFESPASVGYVATFMQDTQLIMPFVAGPAGIPLTSTGYGSQSLGGSSTGAGNAGFGFRALNAVTSGFHLTAVGSGAAASMTTAENSVAIGTNALNAATTTINNVAVGFNTLILEASGSSNTMVGSLAGATQNGGSNNTGVGFDALTLNTANSLVAVGSGALAANTTGTGNTALGTSALNANQTGLNNTALGISALASNTGSSNTAVGGVALFSNTTGINNVAVGYQALNSNVSGNGNTALGITALKVNTAGNNTAVGSGSMVATTSGSSNVAVGAATMNANLTGANNVAIGQSSLLASTSSNGVAVGQGSLQAQTTGSQNVALGYRAGYAPAGTIANATVAGNLNTHIGYQSGIGGTGDFSSTTAIGAQAVCNGANATALGAGASAGAGGAVAIGVDHSGGVATTTTQDAFILGTANHLVTFANVGTGAGSAALGANSPAVTNTAPFTWVKLNVNVSGTISTVYMPVWK